MLTQYVDAAQALVESEHTNADFIQTLIKNSAFILISYSSSDLVEEAMQNWICKLFKVAKGIKKCKNKLEKLEIKTLNLLETICSYRLN